ncbi:hypothetical protein Tco_1017972 [Tanacetum coccineum]|uniref:Copia protein n=1 Tax=Tanacetum coccineum TaxID=301880 RepID=A0ABQ5FV02_9ASTR
MGCYLTSWFSKKQTALAISTTEAEYASTGKVCQQALWMKQALVDFDIKLDDIPILCNNKGAIDLRVGVAFGSSFQKESSALSVDSSPIRCIDVGGRRVILPLLGSVIVSLRAVLEHDGHVFMLLCQRIWPWIIVSVSCKVPKVSVDPLLLSVIRELSYYTLTVLARDYSCISGSYSRLRHPSSTVMEVKKPKVTLCLGVLDFPCKLGECLTLPTTLS